MKIDGFEPADPKIALEEGVTFSYKTKYGDIVIIAKLAGDDNSEFTSRWTKMIERHERERRLGTTDATTQFRDIIRIFADTVVIKWSTTVQSEGKAIQPTPENFVDLMASQACRSVFSLFQTDVSDLANFRAEQEEGTAKN